MSLSFLFPITTSSRYVFYKSLLHKDFSNSSNLFYTGVGQAASSLLNNGELTKTRDKGEENKIQQVINLLEIALQQEQMAEKNFLTRNFISNPAFKTYKKFHSEIISFCSSNKFDYLQFTKLLNQGLQGVENFNKNFIQKEIERITLIQNNIKTLFSKETEKEKRSRREHYIQRGGDYTAASGKEEKINEKTGEKIEVFLHPYSDIAKNIPKTRQGEIASKLQNVIQSYFNDPKELIEICQKNGLIQKDDSETVIFNKIHKPLSVLLTKALVQESKIDLQSTFNKTSLSLMEGIKQFEKGIEVTGQTYKISRNEKTKEVSGEKLYDYILAAYKTSDTKMIEWIDDALTRNQSQIKSSIEKIDTFEKLKNFVEKETISSHSKKRHSRSYKKGIASNILRQAINLKEKEAGALHAEKITLLTYDCLSDMKVNVRRPTQAEISAGVSSLINTRGGELYLEGSSNLKNDFVITFNIPLKKIISGYNSSLIDIVKRSEDEFRRGFRELSSGYQVPEEVANPSQYAKTSTEASMMLKNITDDYLRKIEQAKIKADEVAKEILNIKNNLIVQGSVKDLYTYDNEIGFIGGTLGSDWQTALENLYQMYEKGGISPADLEWLKFAIINCSPESLGSHLKNPIEKYLSFAGAMMMFNYGASQIAYAGEILKGKSVTSPKVFNLYYLNSFYFPGSLVLQIILNRLKECSQELTGIKDQYASGTGVQIINNSHYGIGETNMNANPEARWVSHGEKTISQIEIHFTFLAGMLDILNSLQQKLSNPTV